MKRSGIRGEWTVIRTNGMGLAILTDSQEQMPQQRPTGFIRQGLQAVLRGRTPALARALRRLGIEHKICPTLTRNLTSEGVAGMFREHIAGMIFCADE